MKLEPLFKVENNKLVKLSDNSIVDIDSLQKIEIKWSVVELEPECYNEEFLANLREQLKPNDDTGKFVILVPVADKTLSTAEDFELFVNAFNHTARRIKDCICVAGIELPQQIISEGFAADSKAQCFMETLAIKHAQYVYFAKADSVNSQTSVPSDKIVLY